MKSATLVCGQFPVWCPVAAGGLRRHLCECSAFVCTWGGFTWSLVTPSHPPSSCLILSPLSISTFPLPPPPPPSSLSLHSSRHGADRHSSSAGTLSQVDQVSHLPGVSAACAFLGLSAAQLEVLSVLPCQITIKTDTASSSGLRRAPLAFHNIQTTFFVCLVFSFCLTFALRVKPLWLLFWFWVWKWEKTRI